MAPASRSTKKKKPSTARRSSRPVPAKQKPQPLRREITGVVMLVLSLCVLVSYLGIPAIFIDWIAVFLKGLVGYGYWLSAPALVIAALILFFHRGRPVRLRVSCTLLIPVQMGVMMHMLFCQETFAASAGILGRLWTTGTKLISGGAISGTLAQLSIAMFSKAASVVIGFLLLAVLVMGILELTPAALLEMHRQRPRYEEEDEEEIPDPAPRARRKAPPPPPRRKPASPARQAIDIPLDDDEPVTEPEGAAEAPKPGQFTGFFRHRSDGQPTPDQVLMDSNASAEPAEGVFEREWDTPVSEPPASTPAKPAPLPIEPEEEPLPESPPEPEIIFPVFQKRPQAETAGKPTADAAASTPEEDLAAQMEQVLSAPGGEYHFPPVSFLTENQAGSYAEAAGAELRSNSARLAETLTSFGVDATPADVVRGPSVTRYEFVLEQGVRLSKVTNLADDIALSLGAANVRIAPIPGKISVVGIEVPNKQVTPVLIRDVIDSQEFENHKSHTAFALGRDIGGGNVIGDIEKLPHVLIAGTTGSGKSVCTNSLIISLLYKSTPSEVRFIMVDPKMVELAPYNGIPHLLIPVVTDPKKAAGALQWAVVEMMKRYEIFKDCGVKKLEEYNKLAQSREDLETMPSIVVVIDELADLMLVAAKEVEDSICRVAQMGRASGMHLVIATQRPSSDVITGLMKANIPSRIAFAVASSLESRIILDNPGAEKLVGKGDMLYAPLGAGKPTRIQGCFITPEEIDRVVQYIKHFSGEVHYAQDVMDTIDASMQEKGGKGAAQTDSAAESWDELLPAAVEIVFETGQASSSMLQRRLKVGFSRAARLVDQMEAQGIVGPSLGSKPRQLLITKEQWQEQHLNSND